MIQIPVLVVLKAGKAYLDDYPSVIKYAGEAIAPYSNSITSGEYEWMDRDEFRRHVITAMWGEFHPAVQDLMDRGFSGDGEAMDKLIKLFDPFARWDSSSELILSQKNPECFWERWELGASHTNFFLQTMGMGRGTRKYPIACIDEIEPERISCIFNFNFHTIVEYDRHSS